MSRPMVVLEALVQSDGVAYASTLYNMCKELPEFKTIGTSTDIKKNKPHEPHYQNCYDLVLRKLIEQERIKTVIGARHRRVVILTMKGEDHYLTHNDLSLWARRHRQRLRYYMWYHSYEFNTDSEVHKKVTVLIDELHEQGFNIKRFLKSRMKEAWISVLAHGKDWYEEKFNSIADMYRKYYPDKAEAVITKLKFKVDKEFDDSPTMEYHEEKLGDCLWCGAPIHNEEAKNEADLLEKYTGSEVAMLCCECFRKIKTYEEVKLRVETTS